jgi:hypothetical protein
MTIVLQPLLPEKGRVNAGQRVEVEAVVVVVVVEEEEEGEKVIGQTRLQ